VNYLVVGSSALVDYKREGKPRIQSQNLAFNNAHNHVIETHFGYGAKESVTSTISISALLNLSPAQYQPCPISALNLKT